MQQTQGTDIAATLLQGQGITWRQKYVNPNLKLVIYALL